MFQVILCYTTEFLATWRQQPSSSVQRTIFPGGENSRLKGESNIIYHLDFLHSIPIPSLSYPLLSLLIFTYRMVFYSFFVPYLILYMFLSVIEYLKVYTHYSTNLDQTLILSFSMLLIKTNEFMCFQSDI